MRNFIALSVVMALRRTTSFFSHHSVSFRLIKSAFVLSSLFLLRNSSHSFTAALTVTFWRTGLPCSKASRSELSRLAFVWASDQMRVSADHLFCPRRSLLPSSVVSGCDQLN